MKVEISNADLIDRITILELKMEFLRGDEILIELQKEYDPLGIFEILAWPRDPGGCSSVP